MATPNSSAARSTPRRVAQSYAPPTPLQDLHILDVLELAGSQYRAGAALAMHQSTVCRSLQLMRSQFRLVPTQARGVCRYGQNACLQHLRLAYREHRLMEGLLRIASDGLHQPLLDRMGCVQRVPPLFRSGDHWAGLVGDGLLDAALVSSFCLEQELPPGQEPQWPGLRVMPLGQLRLQLVAPSSKPDARRVLLPRKAATALLHQALARQGYGLEQQPLACQDPGAWIKRARDRGLALPLCGALLPPEWLAQHRMGPLATQPALIEQLWLVLPEGMECTRTARQCLRWLRGQIGQLRARQDPPSPRC